MLWSYMYVDFGLIMFFFNEEKKIKFFVLVIIIFIFLNIYLINNDEYL